MTDRDESDQRWVDVGSPPLGLTDGRADRRVRTGEEGAGSLAKAALVAEALAGEVDTCDIACAAMPARTVGDLAPADANWLVEHAEGCGSCARELARFDRVGSALAGAGELLEESICGGGPPAVAVPRARPVSYARIESPVGSLWVAVSGAGLCEIDFGVQVEEADFLRRLVARGFAPRSVEVPAGPFERCDREIIEQVARQLGEYFAGHRDKFDLPLDFSGISPFTRQVLSATEEVPFGRLETYRGIAQRVGKPGATRAVGNALGRNPIPVVVPCHRVVRSDGTLGGYTGGSDIKPRLLALEGVAIA